MRSSGLTLMELMVGIAIALAFLGAVFPAYQKNSRTRAAQGAAYTFESLIRERKQRAVALGTNAGLCVGQNNVVRLYEYHPFSGIPSWPRSEDFNHAFGVPVSLFVYPTSGLPAPHPSACKSGDRVVNFTQDKDHAKDWQGTITFQSDSESWILNVSPGVLHDSHS